MGDSKLNVTVVLNKGQKIAPLVLATSTTVSMVKVLVAQDFGLPASEQKLFFKGGELADTKTLAQSGVKEGDMLEVNGVAVTGLKSLSDIPQHIWQNPAALQETIKGNPKLLNQLLHQNPTLAEAIMSNNTFMLRAYFAEQNRARAEAKRKQEMEIARLQADPLDPSSQAKISEMIRDKNIRENMEQAIEHNPESFGSVIMLYIPCAVNKKPLKAFVDSGAQMTIMSLDCAKRVGLAHLIDKRWQGMAKGVGTAKIIGRIHAAQIQIGSAFFTMSITVLEGQDMQFLFGLDQLKRHQACIDLKENCLRIQGQKVSFLSEKDIPKSELTRTSGTEKKKMEIDEKSSGRANKKQKKHSGNTTSSSSTRPTNSSGAARQSAISPEKITALMAMGFTRAQAMEALLVTGANVARATNYLLSRT
ncbi:hypothetical protein AAMO2058_000979300 [Amorphochlora amoebiformis]|mmetsp:Transcript_14786/g.23376  ORF Transcript_14786/g.23376 Transcript_14786/m.23376 type:complete len:419 (-) Transcript_14786:81-1337(-)